MVGNQLVSVYFGFSRFRSIFGFPKRGLLRKNDYFASNKDIIERKTQ